MAIRQELAAALIKQHTALTATKRDTRPMSAKMNGSVIHAIRKVIVQEQLNALCFGK